MTRGLLLLPVLLAIPGVRPAEACGCQPQGPPCAEYWNASAVFRGRVDAVQDAGAGTDGQPSRMATFSVLEALRGLDGVPTVQIRTPGSRAACGYAFVAGREYVVYASAQPDGGLTTGRCSRTQPVERAQGDLAYARIIAAGGTVPGRIAGRVVLRSRDLGRARDREQPMRDVPVVLRRGEFSAALRTDATGRFVAVGLDAGSYSVSLDVRPEFRSHVTPAHVELKDVRGCAEVNAAVYPDGRVSGRVIDGLGRPMIGLTIDLTVPAAAGQRPPAGLPERLRSVTRRDGTYVFTRVPPGRFMIGINTRHDDAAAAQPRAFLPGVLDAVDATPVTLGPGERIELPDFTLPAPVAFVHVTGFVLDTAGAPAEGARVYLRGPAEHDYLLAEPVVTDFVGRFTIAAAAGQDYVLFAERNRSGDPRRMDASEPSSFTASSESVPRLILRRR